jgi:integrase
LGKVRRYVGHARRQIEEWELQDLLGLARPVWRLVYLLAADAGLRRAEIIALRAGDVDETRIHVRCGKGGVSRWTVNTSRIRESIIEVGGLRYPRNYGHVGDAFRRDVGRAGLAGDLTLHCLRHRFATRLLRAGVNLVDIGALMGHSDLATTAVYLHDDPSRFDRARLAIEGSGFDFSTGLPESLLRTPSLWEK